MRLLFSKLAIAVLLAVLGLCSAFAQEDVESTDGSNAILRSVAEKTQSNRHWLTADDRLSLLASALDVRVQRRTEPDCSHLVHAIYEAAGFPYDYATSSDLYAGIGDFQRVKTPMPGDLVVWRGHVGIVVKPAQHIFFSFLSSGPTTDDYQTPYWKHRGHPRFYRYVKRTF